MVQLKAVESAAILSVTVFPIIIIVLALSSLLAKNLIVHVAVSVAVFATMSALTL
jgi:hypothetical protein